MTALLDVEGLSKNFGGIVAVSDVSLSVDRGEIASIIGPNGAGKTTAVRVMTTLTRPDGGRVEVAGIDVARVEGPEGPGVDPVERGRDHRPCVIAPVTQRQTGDGGDGICLSACRHGGERPRGAGGHSSVFDQRKKITVIPMKATIAPPMLISAPAAWWSSFDEIPGIGGASS